jgi:uncharacterized protein (TIGR02284 family)
MDTQETIDILNDLIETSKDGEYGFRTSAEQVKTPSLRSLLARRADECAEAARELQQFVLRLGGTAEESGSAAGAMHRGWVAVKSTLSTYDDHAVLEEVERGEDVALESYRDALQEDLSPEARSLVERQFEGVKRNHAQMRALRDQLRAGTT